MTPEDHDAAFAAVSHLPHILAFAYFNCGRAPARRRATSSSLGGPGFRDFTRIAASNPAVWRDILMANREEILKQTQRFRHTLDADGARRRDRQHRGARGADPQRERRARRLADELGDAAHASLTGDAQRAPCSRPASSTSRRCAGSPARVRVPGSKSISNRVLLLAGFAAGTTTIAGPAPLRRHAA